MKISASNGSFNAISIADWSKDEVESECSSGEDGCEEMNFTELITKRRQTDVKTQKHAKNSLVTGSILDRL